MDAFGPLALGEGVVTSVRTLTVTVEGHSNEEDKEQAAASRQRRPDHQLTPLLGVKVPLHSWCGETEKGKDTR